MIRYHHSPNRIHAAVVALAIILLLIIAGETFAQDSSMSKQERTLSAKPTRKQILAMKFEELSALSLEEITELSRIVGVASVDE
ncbi:MAG: hypothetical protein ACOVSW_15520, partial [Candidatus Kapaibacteriota bacterium]